MNIPGSIALTPIRVADLLAEAERMPVYVHLIVHRDARGEDDCTIREWVDAPGSTTSRSTASTSCGLQLVPAPGHTRMQAVVVETGGPPVVVGGDVAVLRARAPVMASPDRLRQHAGLRRRDSGRSG
jgi:hypothetical protein